MGSNILIVFMMLIAILTPTFAHIPMSDPETTTNMDPLVQMKRRLDVCETQYEIAVSQIALLKKEMIRLVDLGWRIDNRVEG